MVGGSGGPAVPVMMRDWKSDGGLTPWVDFNGVSCDKAASRQTSGHPSQTNSWEGRMGLSRRAPDRLRFVDNIDSAP